MADTQHFCLRWNNYQSSITSAFENLRDDEDFVDVTLACDGRSLKAHRVVLSACSPYFRELLKSTPCKHPVIVLQDVAFTDLHALVEFIYHGEVNVHQRSLSSFLKTAEVLRVSGLTQQQAEDSHNLADIHRPANTGCRTPINPLHHQSFADKMVEDAMFHQGASPPPHLHSTPNGAAVNQLLRRAAAAAMRRERQNSTHSDELTANGASALKRQRSENGLQLPGSNNNSPDVISHMPQVTPTDFSTIKHNINNNNHHHHHQHHSLHHHGAAVAAAAAAAAGGLLKEGERNLGGENHAGGLGTNIHNNNNNNGSGPNGNGMSGSFTDKDSLTPSPPTRLGGGGNGGLDDVKSEPMDMVCGSSASGGSGGGLGAGSAGSAGPPSSAATVGGSGASTNLASDDHSNDSSGENDPKYMGLGGDGKGSLSSNNDDDIDASIHSHTAPPSFLMSPADSKLFAQPGFGFSMAALAADPATLVGLNSQFQSAADLAGSPQDSEGPTTTATATMTTASATAPTTTPELTTPTMATSLPILPPNETTGAQPLHPYQSRLNAFAHFAATWSAGGGGHSRPPTPTSPPLDFAGQTADAITILVSPDQFDAHDEGDDGDEDPYLGDEAFDYDYDAAMAAITATNASTARLRSSGASVTVAAASNGQSPRFVAGSAPLSVISATGGGGGGGVLASTGPASGGSKVCPVCHKTFSRAWSLQRHMTDRHFYVPQHLECEICGRTYRSRNSLISHKSQYHGAGVSSKIVGGAGGGGGGSGNAGGNGSASASLRWSQ